MIQLTYRKENIPSIAVGVKRGKVHGLHEKYGEDRFFERVKTRKTLTFETANDALLNVQSFAMDGYRDLEIFGGAKELCVAALAVYALNQGFKNVIIPKKYTFGNPDTTGSLEGVIKEYARVPHFLSEDTDFYCLSRNRVGQIPDFLLC